MDMALQWRHNGRDSVSNHQHRDCFLNRLFRHRSKKTSKLRVTGLCAGNSPETGEFLAQMASNEENASIWWRHHGHRKNFMRTWQHCRGIDGCVIGKMSQTRTKSTLGSSMPRMIWGINDCDNNWHRKIWYKEIYCKYLYMRHSFRCH